MHHLNILIAIESEVITMRFTRFRVLVATGLTALMLCLAVAGGLALHGGSAHAAVIQPHISVTPHHAVTNAFGCASFKFSGSGFTESTATVPNAAVLTVSDPPSFDEDASWDGSGVTTIGVPVNKEGKFSTRLTICDPFVTAPDHWVVSSVDYFTGLPGNSVTLMVD
jgi:hypothetical protein